MRIFAILAVIIVILAISFGFVPFLNQYVLTISSYIKESYLDKKEYIVSFTQSYINQAAQIQQMHKKIEELELENIKYNAMKVEFDNLAYSVDIERHYNDPDVHLVRVLSYATLGVYTKIWIDYTQSTNEPKIFGIIKDGYAIGIARLENNKLLGILNGDPECSYSVYIGKNRVPGTLRATKDGKVVIVYIPAWQSIKSGDNVITSGLDGIFFEEVQVGTITAVNSENGYLQADIQLNNFSNRLSYVWLVDTKIPQKTSLNQDMLNMSQSYEKSDSTTDSIPNNTIN